MKKLMLFICVSCLPLLSQNQNSRDQNSKRGFFGSEQPKLEVIDGARNPELIPEPYRWDEFRRMVMNVERLNQKASRNPLAAADPNFYPLYKANIDIYLGSKLREVADLAFKCDGELRKFNEQRQKALEASLSQNPGSPPQLPERLGWRAGLAIVDKFKHDVVALFDDSEKAQLQEFVLNECVKRVKFYKLPSP